MNHNIRKVFDRKGVFILAGIFTVLFVAETVSSLRKRKQNRTDRMVTNSLIAVPGFLALRLVLLPAMVLVAFKNQAWKKGLLHQLSMPSMSKNMAGFLMLDYTNYAWHILNHKVPLLWRFHLVHHTDLDLDVTTAIRFHAGEMFTSVFYRSLAVLATGVSPLLVLIYEICFEAATQFHHSNWKLPFWFEKLLNKFIVTPRMHGIHHSVERNETDSNYAVIFSFWDRIGNTISLGKRQEDIIIGVPSYQDASELNFRKLLELPFGKIKPWPEENSLVPGTRLTQLVR